MSYTVDWIAKVISIPTADLTPVSGNRYSLLMSDCLDEVRRLEWEFDQGLWAPAILDHSDTRFDFAGVDYAPFDEFINGYTVEFTGTVERVDLLGSNNNLIDILIVNGVSVVPNNSAGLQVYSSGSGLSAEQATQLGNVNAAVAHRRTRNPGTGDEVIYEADGTTPRLSFDSTDDGSQITEIAPK